MSNEFDPNKVEQLTKEIRNFLRKLRNVLDEMDAEKDIGSILILSGPLIAITNVMRGYCGELCQELEFNCMEEGPKQMDRIQKLMETGPYRAEH